MMTRGELVCEVRMTLNAADANLLELLAQAEHKTRDQFLGEWVLTGLRVLLEGARQSVPPATLRMIEGGFYSRNGSAAEPATKPPVTRARR